jgi:hypothetical protein
MRAPRRQRPRPAVARELAINDDPGVPGSIITNATRASL